MQDNKGFYADGKPHSEGGIPAVNTDTGEHIEVEQHEYKICRDGYNSTDVLNYVQMTNKEVLDDIHTKYACKFNPNEVQSGDFIICKVVVLDPSKHDRSGTVKQILDQMQSEKSCRVSGSDNMELGGQVGYEFPECLFFLNVKR